MAKSLSPLRYPGGKSKIYDKVKNLIIANDYNYRTYVEPFAGGFGIGIGLLCENIVPSVILNDFDSHIFHFWHAVLNETDELLRLIKDTPITIEERERQKNIFNSLDVDPLADGFSTLFLNRVNYSGIIKGGPIGGLNQLGKYKLDCRFDKKNIMSKIESIAQYKSKIKLYNNDAGYLIRMNLMRTKSPIFLNIDPPYVVKGSLLYTNFFNEADHIALQQVIAKHLNNKYPWIITYDDCQLARDLYKNYHIQEYSIVHNAGRSVKGKEIVATNMPVEKFVWS